MTMQPAKPAAAESIFAQSFRCDADVARILALKAAYRRYSSHETILDAGTETVAVYIVISGRAKALVFAIDGRLVLVEEFQMGDLFGEGGLFGQAATLSDVAAVEDVLAGTFPNHVFVGLMENYASIAFAISCLLTARLNAITRRLIEGATLSAAGRIHAELLRQARAGHAMTIRPGPVLSVFAQQVLSTRETVSRTINALQKRGIIRRDEDSLTIIAPHRLEELIY